MLASLLLTAERRKKYSMYIVMLSCAIAQDMFVAINFESVTGTPSPNNAACLAVGSLMHLSFLAAIIWSGAAAVSIFVMLFNNGRNKLLAYYYVPVRYHVICWSLVKKQKKIISFF